MKKPIRRTGRVVSGARRAAGFTQLDWVQDQCWEKLGFRPFPGTLNVEVVADGETGLLFPMGDAGALVDPAPALEPRLLGGAVGGELRLGRRAQPAANGHRIAPHGPLPHLDSLSDQDPDGASFSGRVIADPQLVGVLPGIGAPTAIALLLPLTFTMSPTTAIIMLAGIYYGGQYGGSTTSILVNVPGEPASVVTTLEGYRMARKGRAGAALGISAFGSFIAGTIGIVVLMLLAPPLARVALMMGPPEYTALMITGLTLVIYLSGKSMIKSLMMGVLGLILGTVNMDPMSGQLRYTMGTAALMAGFLTGKAAATILSRFFALYDGGRVPEPAELLATSDARLREAGFSRAKVASLKDIAARTQDGTIPPRRRLARLPDEAVIERLVQVRGVGRWTVEMFLMFTLGRQDVLPVDDYGVRSGFRIAYGHDQMPRPRELAEFGLRWAPYRSLAAWYLWRAVDLHREKGE